VLRCKNNTFLGLNYNFYLREPINEFKIMIAKESILRKIRILLTNQFDSPEEAFRFFNSESDGRLRKSEIKKLLKSAAVNGFITGFVAIELLNGYDESSTETINWEEFKLAIVALEKEM
jgi:Ca2+-binding EF-hand superfamily protein